MKDKTMLESDGIKLTGSNLFATFSDKELVKYIEQHTANEKRLLWLGVGFGVNNLVKKLNEEYHVYKK